MTAKNENKDFFHNDEENDDELEELIRFNFDRYESTFKALASSENLLQENEENMKKARRTRLDKIIDKNFKKYDDVFKDLA